MRMEAEVNTRNAVTKVPAAGEVAASKVREKALKQPIKCIKPIKSILDSHSKLSNSDLPISSSNYQRRGFRSSVGRASASWHS